METRKFNDQKSEYIARDKNNNIIRTTETCSCGINYHEHWELSINVTTVRKE